MKTFATKAPRHQGTPRYKFFFAFLAAIFMAGSNNANVKDHQNSTDAARETTHS
jgi:hypothetical protein